MPWTGGTSQYSALKIRPQIKSLHLRLAIGSSEFSGQEFAMERRKHELLIEAEREQSISTPAVLEPSGIDLDPTAQRPCRWSSGPR